MWIFQMIIVVVFTSVVLSCLPLIHCVTDKNISKPSCPKSFSCPAFPPFQYPFYNDNSTTCGFIKVTCTWKGGEIQIEGGRYPILERFDSGSSVLIYNRAFDELLNHNTCEALMNNITSPRPLLFSITIDPFITLFKCAKNLGYDYFGQLNYTSYNRCQDHNYYYKYLLNDATVPNDLPHACQVIQLPVKRPWQFPQQRPDVTNISHLLSSGFSISFKLSPSCKDCYRKGGHCNASNGEFQCLDAKKGKQNHIKLILVLAGSAFIIILSAAVFIIWWRYNDLKNTTRNKSPDLEDKSLFSGLSVFSYNDLKNTTRNFNPAHELGDGGFGAVYYGKLQDGREVAVKRLYEHNYKRVKHFMNEVEVLTKLRHPNLVVLYGCTTQQSRELLLVYEYIPNGTVADHLHGEQANPSSLTWPRRLNISIETARALVYLHASEIIHRDVKTNNILLDHNFCVKVADFGLSRLLPNNVSHVSTAPQGTPGYVDPEYHQRYQLTDKSDVYSFGVVLIELISSMVAVDLNRPQDEISLANFAINRIQRCELNQLIDPVLGSDSNAETMNMITSVAELAFRCLQYDSEMRPNMNEVLDTLMDIQAKGRTESIRDFETMKPSVPSKTNDSVVLLQNFPPSPVSFTSELQSDSSASTTVSSNGDRYPSKNCIGT